MQIVTNEQEFLEYVIKSIVNKPDDVKIIRTVDEMGVLYTVHVNKEDVSKAIGKAGNMSKAIRTLLKVVGYKNSVRATMKIAESILVN